jgi:hypothetical protein
MSNKLIAELREEDRELIHVLRRLIMAFTDSITKLDADVKALIAAVGPAATAAAVATAVAAKDTADAAAVDAVDAQVVAAIPAPAPAVVPAV